MRIESPNGKLSLALFQQSDDDGVNRQCYSLDVGDRPALLASEMAIELDNHLSQWALGCEGVPRADTLVTSLYGAVDVITPFATPWRVIMVAEGPSQLLENNDILLNLNPPCAIEDTSWIKPGKCLRDMTITNADSASRELEVTLDFLRPGRAYCARFYRDDPAAETRTRVKLARQEVYAASTLAMCLPVCGGEAIWLRPKQDVPNP